MKAPACICERPCEVDPCASQKAAKGPRRKRRRRRAKPRARVAAAPQAKPSPIPTVSEVFRPFAEQLRAIDWRDPVKREAEVAAVLGQVLVAVALSPTLTDADREKLQWVMTLSRQMVTFRDASAIEAARRQLAGGNAEESANVDGPQLEEAVRSESVKSESSERGAGATFRGRPRVRAFA